MIRITRNYSSPACAIQKGERFDCSYADFDREGREGRLIVLAAGQELEPLTTPSNGMLYVRVEHDGREWAVRALPDTWEQVVPEAVAAE